MKSSRRSVQIAGSDAERQPSLQTTARTDLELLAVWLKSHVDGSEHTVRAYGRIGRRFLDAFKVAGVDLRRATLDDVQTALETIRVKLDGTPAKAANGQRQRRHREGAARLRTSSWLYPLQRGAVDQAQKGAPATRILSEFDTLSILRAAKPGRERILCEVGYYDALRVSEIASLTWSQVLPRETGEVQLALVGKGDKPRHVLLPAEVAKALRASAVTLRRRIGCSRSPSGASITS